MQRQDYTPEEVQAEVDELRAVAGSGLSRSARKLLWMVLLVALALTLLHLMPARALHENVDMLQARLYAAGAWAPLLFFLGGALLSAAGFPRIPLSFAAGLFFGFWGGLGLALATSLAGSYATFCLGRWGGRDWVRKRVQRFKRVHFVMENQSFITVILSRLLPITNIVINLMLSLSAVRHRDFVLGSLVGFLPAAAIAVLTGGSVREPTSFTSVIYLVTAALIVLLVLVVAWQLRLKWNREKCLSSTS
jgi:uncharacterized membrane protein YdjX (TVP38/TMEM64 family)